MKRQRHSPEQIIRKLRTADQFLNQGQSVADVCWSPGGFRCHLSPLAAAVGGEESQRGQTPQGAGTGELSALAKGFSAGVATTRRCRA